MKMKRIRDLRDDVLRIIHATGNKDPQYLINALLEKGVDLRDAKSAVRMAVKGVNTVSRFPWYHLLGVAFLVLAALPFAAPIIWTQYLQLGSIALGFLGISVLIYGSIREAEVS